MFFEGLASEKAVASPPRTPAAEIQSMPAREFLSKQLLANTSFLHPDCTPALTTSRDPASGDTRIVILAAPAPILAVTTTAPTLTPTLPTTANAPAPTLTIPPTAAATPGVPRILYEQQGTTTADFEALLARVETDVHRRLQSLPSPGVEAVRLSVDAARLQRENKALMDELQRTRGVAMTLVLPQPKASSALPPPPPPPAAADQQMEPSTTPDTTATTAETTATKPTSPSQTTPTLANAAPPTPAASLTASGLPQSRTSARRAAGSSSAGASTAAGTTVTTEVSLPGLDALHDGIVSPRTIPPRTFRAAILSGGGGSPSAGQWSEGQEADDVAAWVRSIANPTGPAGAGGAGEALTPPLTPPPAKKSTLPRSRKFEGR